MIRQAFRAVAEGLGGIRRNLMVGLVCTSTVALCCFLVSAFLAIAANLEYITGEVESQVEIKAYLVDDFNRNLTDELLTAIRGIPGVTECRFISKEQALEDLQQQFGNEAGLLEAVADMNPLPDSVDIRAIQLLERVAERVSGMPGVEWVRDRRELVAKLLSLTRGLRTAGLFLAGLLGLVALLITANTIRIAVFTRRTEIAIMKLVGATDGFIRGPFVIEGIILSGLGAALAMLGIWYSYDWIQLNIAQALPFLPVLSREPLLVELAWRIVAAGVVVGALGSAVSVRRYLKI